VRPDTLPARHGRILSTDRSSGTMWGHGRSARGDGPRAAALDGLGGPDPRLRAHDATLDRAAGRAAPRGHARRGAVAPRRPSRRRVALVRRPGDHADAGAVVGARGRAAPPG